MINMRCLHEELSIKSNFRDWARRKLNGFNINDDFYVKEIQESNGGKPRKDYYVSDELAEKIKSSYSLNNRSKTHGAFEHGALCAIEQLLGIKLERQYKIGKYRIDGYHVESNTAYEVDEPSHAYQQQEDDERQAYIESKLGCKFVRIKV